MNVNDKGMFAHNIAFLLENILTFVSETFREVKYGRARLVLNIGIRILK